MGTRSMTSSEGPSPVRDEFDELGDKPFGPVAAAFLAAGVGSLVLGLVTTISEASASFADKLNWSNPVGPLSGKTIITVIAWLAAWAILYVVFRGKDPAPRGVYWLTTVLVAVGLVLTFPIFFDLFKS
jgi:hypothetical protein